MKDDFESVAILTIKRPPELSTQTRKDIVDWLKNQAKFLEDEAVNMSDRQFRARFLLPKRS